MSLIAVYVSSTQFTVATDLTADIMSGRRVEANCLTDGYKYGTVESSSYSSPNTTVTLKATGDDLTPNLSIVDFGVIGKGADQSMPEHTHDGSEGAGGTVDHGATTGKDGDDHTQYHNDTRGDARYYRENEHLNSSAGVGDAGKPIKLDANGHVDATMVNDADIDHDQTTNYVAGQHRTIDDEATGSTDLWSADKINELISTISGTLSQETIDAIIDLIASAPDVLDTLNELAAAMGDDPNFSTTITDLITTTSGDLSTEIDDNITTHESGSSHDSRYYTETESDANWVTNSGTIDHDTIVNNHNLTTDIDHDTLTNTHNLTTDIDHGGITGLTDDDHTQYLLADGSRDITGTISGTTPIDDGDLTTKGYVDRFQTQLAGTTYFLHNHSDPIIPGYKQILIQAGDEAEGYDTVTIGSADGETLIEEYVTVSGEPNTEAIPAGSWTAHFALYVGAITGDNYIRAKWYKRDADGNEAYLFQVSSGDIITAGSILHVDGHTVVSGIHLDVTDRLVVKIYAQTTSAANREFRYYYEGQENYTYFSTPVVSNFILEHNNLVGLNNGDYKHLTATEYTDLTDGGETNLHIHDDRYYTESEITTISGDLSTEIDDDITTHEAGTSHDSRYYTETELDAGQLDNRYHTEAEITTISGDLQTGINAKDNYQSWSFAVDGGTKDAITSSDVLDFVGGDNITITRTADDQITISGTAGGGSANHSELDELDYTSAGHTGFVSTTVLTTTSGDLQTDIDTKGDMNDVVDDTAPQLGGDLDVNGHNIDLGGVISVNGTYVGTIMTVTVNDASTLFGDALYIDTGFEHKRADASLAATMPCSALALESGSGSNKVLLKGQICDTSWNWDPGNIYVSITTGEMTQVAPAGSAEQVQIIGWALSADTIFFSPNVAIAEV